MLVGFTDPYGRLMGKRLDAGFFLEEGGTHACDYLLTVDMEMDPVPPALPLRQLGEGLRRRPFGAGPRHPPPGRLAGQDGPRALRRQKTSKTGLPVAPAPRSILRRQTDRLAKTGLKAFAASELEYYTFRQSYRDAAAKNYQNLEPVGWYLEDYHALQGAREEPFNAAARRHLAASGVPVESSKGEWGLGQHELNVRYAEVTTMADRHVVYKQCLKETADKMGLSGHLHGQALRRPGRVQLPRIHMSLWKGGRNAFAGGKSPRPRTCSAGSWAAGSPARRRSWSSTPRR